MTFVVLKFGGTSVATADGWATILARIRGCLDADETPVVVHSALSGVSNALERVLRKAPFDEHHDDVDKIAAQHAALAGELGLGNQPLIDTELQLLRQLTAGIALIGEASPRQQARVLALGERMATRLGHAYLARSIDIASVDARELLRANAGNAGNPAAHFLNAGCDFAPSETVRQRLEHGTAFLTQGFIAADENHDTVVLGRGGSDTSASYLAALIGADRIEIWTDVAGMYSADPRLVPDARLLKKLDFAEAQEIASTGARVLHPRCIRPAQRYNIALQVRSTHAPEQPGTLICASPGSHDARLKAVSARQGLTLLSMETSGMWQQPGFLARAFGLFARHQLSIDLISSSQTSVTVSLDGAVESDDERLRELCRALDDFCRVTVVRHCAAISLVGRRVRAILHEVAPAFDLFKDFEIHLVSQAANDLNFTFVVDERYSNKLVQRLHDLLIQRPDDHDPVLGAAYAPTTADRRRDKPWWQERRDELIALTPPDEPLFVYNRATLVEAAQSLRALESVDRLLYSSKANSHPDVLRALSGAGVDMECVSVGELRLIEDTLGADGNARLFTPNFAPRSEYAQALQTGALITVDNRFVLEQWGELFAGHDLLLRVDPGDGQGHHKFVRTAGKQSKFGIPLDEVDATAARATALGARVVGLHAHKGSGIVDASTWSKTARTLAQAAAAMPSVRILNLGGGLGVPDKNSATALNLAALDDHLLRVKDDYPDYELWLEPGRFLVASAGVLLTRVTQIKNKDDVRYVGVNTGMNSLIRPALYGAYHHIANLSRLDDTRRELVDVVGPICESADVLGKARMLSPCAEGDVVLIGNAGAYGRVMASDYNQRPPGDEIVI